MKSGQPSEIFHHALSTKRDLLRTRRSAPSTPNAAVSRPGNDARRLRWHQFYPPPSIQKLPALPCPRAMSALSSQRARAPNVCVIRKYPDSNLSLPFTNAHASFRERLNEGSTDEDHMRFGGSTAYAIPRDPSNGSCANQQKQQSSACRHSIDSRQSTARIQDRRPRDRGSALELRLHERPRSTTM